MNSFEEFEPIVFEAGHCEGDRIMINIFAGFEASGNGVDGEEKSVADPVPQS